MHVLVDADLCSLRDWSVDQICSGQHVTLSRQLNFVCELFISCVQECFAAHYSLWLCFFALFSELAEQTKRSGISVLIADPAVHRTSPPEKASNGKTNPVFRLCSQISRSFFNLGYIITRIAPQRVASTELMCAVAKPPAVALSGDPRSCSSALDAAPVYKNLEEIPCVMEEDARRKEARKHLWALSQKWTRLDTHPDAVPLPPRLETVYTN